MGSGFWILIWDGYSSGLNMINPRLLTNSDGENWFRYTSKQEKDELIKCLSEGLKCKHFKIIEQI